LAVIDFHSKMLDPGSGRRALARKMLSGARCGGEWREPPRPYSCDIANLSREEKLSKGG